MQAEQGKEAKEEQGYDGHQEGGPGRKKGGGGGRIHPERHVISGGKKYPVYVIQMTE